MTMTKGIHFPKMHVAASTVNRIINAANGVMQAMPQPTDMQMPELPDTRQQSAALDAQMQAPPQPAEMPPGGEGALLDASLTGEDMVASVVGQDDLS